MKKLFAILALATSMTACNNSDSKTDTTTNTDSVKMNNDAAKMDTSANSTMTTGTNMQEGTMTMKGGKMMVMTNGAWAAMDKTMTCTNGCKVMTDGHMVMKDGKKMTMTEGMTCDKDGNCMDMHGKMVDMK